MPSRFTKEELNKFIVKDLGDRVAWHSDIDSKVFLVDLKNPKLKLRFYVFNCTCPPGGRSLDEFKIQMIIENQKRGERGHLKNDDDRFVIVMGLADPFDDISDGVYVLWDAEQHKEFAYSANLQCYLDPMIKALSEDVVTCLKKGNQEKVVVALRRNLPKAITRRVDLYTQALLEE